MSFIVNRMNERVLAGQSIETLLAVLMFVLMGITLERSKIANDLLTTMARVFGPLPGGLAVSIVVVGAFLAASTGIVGATVVTMGLLALPTMLRNNYSPELATGVIAASGTLGQIIPPSIVIVLLGTLAGDLYSTAQETRAVEAGCTDALTYLGEPAVVSVGTLFQAALLPGIMLALLYALYAFGYALLNPDRAPAVELTGGSGEAITRSEGLTWLLGAPAAIIIGAILLGSAGVIGSQNISVSAFSDVGQGASLRTNVSEECKASMIDLHGQAAWDQAVAEQEEIDAAGGIANAERLSEEELAAAREAKIASAAPDRHGCRDRRCSAGADPGTGSGYCPVAFAAAFDRGGDWSAVDVAGRYPVCRADNLIRADLRAAGPALCHCDLRVQRGRHALCDKRSDPGGVPAAGSDHRRAGLDPGWYHQPHTRCGAGGGWCDHAGSLSQAAGSGAVGQRDHLVNICGDHLPADGREFRSAHLSGERAGRNLDRVYSWLMRHISYAHVRPDLMAAGCLFSSGVLSPVVRETAKVTSMVFTILIGSQLLNLVVISFGGEHYIQQFLQSFDNELTVFLIVMLVLFMSGLRAGLP